MKKTEAEKNSKIIKIWNATRKQGKNKYIFIISAKFFVGLLIVHIGISLYTGNNFNFATFAALCIGGIIGATLSWYANEKEYNDIIEKQSKKENNIKNSNKDI